MMSCAISNNSAVLAICCAEERIQIVLGASAVLIHAEEIHCPGQSIQHLHTAIDRALGTHNLGVKDLAGIACVRGPGSFTGLRISHACVYGLALPFSTPMAGLLYHPLLASQIQPEVDQETWVLTYARKRQVYVQSFRQGHARDKVRPVAIADLLPALMDRPGRPMVLGSGVRHNPEISELHNLHILPPHFDTPMPAVLLAAAHGATYSTHAPTPLYLRKSDAEDNLAAIASLRGITEAEARATLFDYE